MKNNQRTIQFFDFRIHPSKQSAVAPPMTKVVGVLQQLMAEGKASYKIQFETETLEIRDIEIFDDDEAAVLFVTRTDPMSPNAVYADPEKKESRVIEKRRGEVGEFGAHVAISLVEEAGRPNTYVTLIEQVSGVSRSHVERLFNGTIRERYSEQPETFTCEDRSGKKDRYGGAKLVEFRPILELMGHPSPSFIEDINSGNIKGLSLHQEQQKQQIGGRSYLLAKEATLQVKVVHDDIATNLWNDLKGALATQAKNWSRARIRFQGPGGRPVTAEIDTATGNIIGEAFVKSTSIGDQSWVLHNSSDKVVKPFAARMIEELVEVRQAES